MKVVLGPHPELSNEQTKAIELDYGMRNGRLAIDVRRGFLYYFLKRLGLDDAKLGRRPQDQQVVLINSEEVGKALELG